jgi:DNA end-binding protein Ku
MPRTLWKGTLTFGLVSIPVGLYTAVESKSPAFNQLRSSDRSRISYQRVAKADGEPVEYDDIVKGYEYARDQYVVFDKDELDALKPASSRAIEIEQFVPLEQIDPIYFDRTYYLAPEATGAKAYGLLASAMADQGTVALCRITMRDREHLATVRLRDGLLVLETMHWPDEIREFSLHDVDLDELPEPRDREVEMAQQLIAGLTEDFDPDQWRDTYRERVLGAVQAKVEGAEVVAPAEEEAPARVVDLMAALEASVEAATERRKQREAS